MCIGWVWYAQPVHAKTETMEALKRVHVGGWGPLYLHHIEHQAVRGLADKTFRVYASLCAHAGCQRSEVVLSVERLAWLCSSSPRTIQRHLRKLEAAKLIRRCRRYGKIGQELRSEYGLLEPSDDTACQGPPDTTLSPLIDDPKTEAVLTESPLSPPPSVGDSGPDLVLVSSPLVQTLEQLLLGGSEAADAVGWPAGYDRGLYEGRYSRSEIFEVLREGQLPEDLGDLLHEVRIGGPELLDVAVQHARSRGYPGRRRTVRRALFRAASNLRELWP